jgi:uncharacterized protein (DUF885 family)
MLRFITQFIQSDARLGTATVLLLLGTTLGSVQCAAVTNIDEPQSVAKTNSVALQQLVEQYWSDLLVLKPALALAQGDLRYEAEFDDSLEDTWRERMLAMLNHYSNALDTIPAASLSADDRTTMALLRYKVKRDLDFYGSTLFETARMLPINQFDSPQLTFALEAAGSGNYPFKTLSDYDNALIRADHYSRWTDEAIARLNEGLKANIVLPRMVIERILPELATALNQAPEATEFWQPIQQFPADIEAADRARLTAAYRIKIATVIQPAYQRLNTYLSQTYLPKAQRAVSLGHTPRGRALYAYLAAYHTTTQLSPTAIHALGRKEVQRLMLEVDQIRQARHFIGSTTAFMASVRADPLQHFQSPTEVIPAYQAARGRIIERLPQLFSVMPKARYEIRAMPESARASTGNGNYVAAAADGSRPGILWMNIYAPGVLDRFNVMTISLHEGLPGHHFQTSIGQEHTELPSFRRFDDTTAYVEGWGLYAESLGKEMGLFDDQWQYFGHLQYALLRANRLVIDTGLHALGWSVPQGVRWMMQHSSMNEAQATAEVERYVAIPGQALAYKVGELKIREIRSHSRDILGDRFDIRAFHDRILAGGSMPLSVLDSEMTRWATAQKLTH